MYNEFYFLKFSGRMNQTSTYRVYFRIISATSRYCAISSSRTPRHIVGVVESRRHGRPTPHCPPPDNPVCFWTPCHPRRVDPESYPSPPQLLTRTRSLATNVYLLLATLQNLALGIKKFTNHRQVLTSYDQRGGSMERRYLIATLALVAM